MVVEHWNTCSQFNFSRSLPCCIDCLRREFSPFAPTIWDMVSGCWTCLPFAQKFGFWCFFVSLTSWSELNAYIIYMYIYIYTMYIQPSELWVRFLQKWVVCHAFCASDTPACFAQAFASEPLSKLFQDALKGAKGSWWVVYSFWQLLRNAYYLHFNSHLMRRHFGNPRQPMQQLCPRPIASWFVFLPL